MKQEDSKILAKLGKEPGFKVPENYFADFSKNLADQLPEVTLTPQEKPTLWTKVRAYVYMAAMFAGIFCMMKVFNQFNGTATAGPGIEAQAPAGNGTNKAIIDDKAADTQQMNYQDSVRMSMEQATPDRQSDNE